MMKILTILNWIKNHKNIVKNIVLSLAVAFSLLFGISTCKENKKLSDELKIANNNIEAYLELAGSLLASGVLLLDIKNLGNTNDSILTNLNNAAVDNGIKPKTMLTAATLTLNVDVKLSKQIEKDTIHDLITILKDTVYSDTLKYNNLTTVYYTIGRDSVNIGLKLNNTLYLYIYKEKKYRYKSFWKRLTRFCWKKDETCKYKIVNTNDLLSNEDVRVVNAK